MAYTYNIPQATDQLNVSQGQMLANFTAIGCIGGNANANSNAFNGTAGLNYVFLPANGANPPAGTTFGATNAIFSFNNVTTAQNEVYINKQNQATVVQIPITASILSTNSAPGVNSTGWTYLPSGIILKWTRGTVGAGNYNMNAGGAFGPNFTQVIMAWVTGNTVTAGVASTFAVTGIIGAGTVSVGGAAPGFFYILAIGY